MVNERFPEDYTFRIENLKDVVKVPIGNEDTGEIAFYMMLVRDANGFIGYWIEDDAGRVATGDASEDEHKLFEDVVSHVGWA